MPPLCAAADAFVRAACAAMGPAGSTLFGFARTHLMKDEVRPFMWGIAVAFISLGGLSIGGTKEARADSKYLNPPKHH